MGRPGHISPCFTGGPMPCPQCAGPESATECALIATSQIERAIHKLKPIEDHTEAAIKLWKAKILVDEARALMPSY